MSKSSKPERIDCLGLGIMPLDLLFVVDRYPDPGSKIDGKRLTIQGGGPVPNVMAGLRRMGHTTALITAVADDLAGQYGQQALRDEGIECRHLVIKKGVSDVAAGFVEDGDGRRTLVLNREIHVTPRDIRLQNLPRPRLIHLDGRDFPACLKLARWGKKVGATITFDIGSMRNDVSEVFPLVDHLVVADQYAFGFTGRQNAREAIVKLKKYCPGAIVITEGIRGSIGHEHGKFVYQPAYRVDSVDTTGAGDAYHTGYLYGLLHGFSLPERMQFGAAVAALSCTKLGARAGIPTLRQTTLFLRKRPPVYA